MKVRREIERIHARNQRVEADKAWETSWTRKIIIAVLTYFIVVLFFYAAGLPKPLINSIVPTIGFLLSTFSLSFFKKMWLEYCYKR
ncbi:hypothetical protein HYS47_04960 [Candidatus Woesearchaeota archaeon]|nr:hypothetical protein [Candidatus Woesearchaeota archaeon]